MHTERECSTCGLGRGYTGFLCPMTNCHAINHWKEWRPIVSPPHITEFVKHIKTQDEKNNLFHQVATDIAEVLSKKNHDYGDSFFDTYKTFGDMGTCIRLTDKVGRLKTLSQGLTMEVKEPIEDVYMDIAGYCILTLVSKLRQQKGE